jgi:hypothetical protein
MKKIIPFWILFCAAHFSVLDPLLALVFDFRFCYHWSASVFRLWFVGRRSSTQLSCVCGFWSVHLIRLSRWSVPVFRAFSRTRPPIRFSWSVQPLASSFHFRSLGSAVASWSWYREPIRFDLRRRPRFIFTAEPAASSLLPPVKSGSFAQEHTCLSRFFASCWFRWFWFLVRGSHRVQVSSAHLWVVAPWIPSPVCKLARRWIVAVPVRSLRHRFFPRLCTGLESCSPARPPDSTKGFVLMLMLPLQFSRLWAARRFCYGSERATLGCSSQFSFSVSASYCSTCALALVFDLCLWLNDLCLVLFLTHRIKGSSFFNSCYVFIVAFWSRTQDVRWNICEAVRSLLYFRTWLCLHLVVLPLRFHFSSLVPRPDSFSIAMQSWLS